MHCAALKKRIVDRTLAVSSVLQVCDGQCSLNEVIVQGASSRHAGAAAGDAAGTLASHAADLGAFLEQVATRPPLLVGHSFGGLILQRYALDSANAAGAEGMPTSAGLAFLASNNPEGTDFGRFLRKAPIMTIKVRSERERRHAVLAPCMQCWVRGQGMPLASCAACAANVGVCAP